MNLEQIFVFMKDCLKEWNYPQIHALNDEQVAEIFGVANRPFLVHYLLKQIYPEAISSEDYNTNYLADFIYKAGFCSKDEMVKIFPPDFHKEQVAILYKMFNFLKIISDNTLILPEKMTNDQLDEICNMDLNLFPSYGPLVTINPEERNSQVQQLEEAMKRFDETIKVDFQEEINESNITSEYVTSLINDIKIHLPEISFLVDSLSNQEVSYKGDILKSLELNDIIRKNKEDLLKVSEYFENITKVMSFLKHRQYESGKGSKLPIQEREPFRIMKALKEYTNEMICSMSKDMKQLRSNES